MGFSQQFPQPGNQSLTGSQANHPVPTAGMKTETSGLGIIMKKGPITAGLGSRCRDDLRQRIDIQTGTSQLFVQHRSLESYLFGIGQLQEIAAAAGGNVGAGVIQTIGAGPDHPFQPDNVIAFFLFLDLDFEFISNYSAGNEHRPAGMKTKPQTGRSIFFNRQKKGRGHAVPPPLVPYKLFSCLKNKKMF
jgi:hypothetical protein